ncbi:hypothetical protein [Paracoccus luteus]|uniref:hypothetical protein n=1 Tax=Paracoccus luteus TaxID=2508543 RepID=UPI00106F7330|nr:hypothetical protein [Paracoccus luteus]
MIAQQSFALFDEAVERLPALAPPDSLVPADAPPATHAGYLSPQAMPDDPAACAIVAVIDHAIPFAHRLLTTASGHSRVAAIWLQDAPARDRRPDIAFGQELRGTMIDAMRGLGGDGQSAEGSEAEGRGADGRAANGRAGEGRGADGRGADGPVAGGPLRDDDAIYRACGLMNPGRGAGADLSGASSHGAAVAALAAGFDPADPAGRAHPVIAVALPDFSVADTSGSFSPLFLQAAVVYVVGRARGLARSLRAARPGVRPPLVVNLSMGLTAGARDGSSLIAQLQDAIADAPGEDLGSVHFVLPTGNNRQSRTRAVLATGQSIGWQLPPQDATPSAVELWGPAEPAPGTPMRARIALPDGRAGETGADRGMGHLTDPDGHVVARTVLQYRAVGAGFVRPCLTIIVPPTLPPAPATPWAPAGQWSLTPLPGSPHPVEVAVQRDDAVTGFRILGRQSRLVDPACPRRDASGRWPGPDPDPPVSPIRRNGTSNSYAGGLRQIRVGASLAAPRADGVGVAPYAGLLDDGRAGDVTAPADRSESLRGMVVPGVRGAARARLSGTSLSAPQLTRWLARALAAGRPLPDRAAIQAAVRKGAGQADAAVPDLGPPDALPWRSGLDG